MSDFNIHIKKFEMFKKDAENETVSHPTRIEAYFCAAYQLIEACSTNPSYLEKLPYKQTSIVEIIFNKGTKYF